MKHQIRIEIINSGPIYWSCTCVGSKRNGYPVLGLVILDQLALQQATHEHILHKIESR